MITFCQMIEKNFDNVARSLHTIRERTYSLIMSRRELFIGEYLKDSPELQGL